MYMVVTCAHIKPVIPTVLTLPHLHIFTVSLPPLIPNSHLYVSHLHFLPFPLCPPSFSFIQSPASHHLHKLKERDIFSLFMVSTERDCGEKCLSFHRDASCRICLLMIISYKSAIMIHFNTLLRIQK